MQQILDWAEVLSALTKAQQIYSEVHWPARTEPLGRSLKSTFNVDVHEERHLFYLMQAVAVYGPAMRGEALALAHCPGARLNTGEAFVLAQIVRQASAGLLVELSEYMPPELGRGPLALRSVERPGPTANHFYWRNVYPTPLQLKRYQSLLGPKVPTYVFPMDPSEVDGITAFMSLAACVHIAVSTTMHVLPDQIPQGAAQDLSAVAIVTTYLSLPETWRRQ
jgi:hypothetical protein